MAPKNKNSILICELDDGTQDLYVNGVHILCGERVVGRIDSIANSAATVASVLGCMATAAKTVDREFQPKEVTSAS